MGQVNFVLDTLNLVVPRIDSVDYDDSSVAKGYSTL